VSTITNLPRGSGTWTVEAPDGVTIAPPTDGGSTLKITIDYTPLSLFGQSHGIIDLKFTEPSGNANNFDGLKYDFVFEFKNSLGVPVNGFVLYNSDDLPVTDPDVNSVHPSRYAHFHGVQADTFSPLNSTVLLQDFITPASFGAAAIGNIAPGQIQTSGTLDNGRSVTGKPMILHQVEQPDVNDNFHISLFPQLSSGQILLASSQDEVSLSEGDTGSTDYTFTIFRAGESGAINSTSTTVQYNVTGTGDHPADGNDFIGGALPQGTITFEPFETSKTIVVSVQGDTVLEDSETFKIELSNPSDGATVVTAGDATGTIVKEDETPAPVIKNLTAGNDFWPGPGFPGDGNGGNEIINGLAGNDTISGGAGDDTINGGSGRDTAVWTSYRTQNAISLHPESDITVSGPEGSDTLRNIERYVFADGEFITDTAHEAAQVYRLYGASLDREPDASGLKSWTTALISKAATLTDVAQGFTESREFTDKYGALDDKGYITLLYQNVLDRNPDAGGLAAWEGGLKGGLGRADVLVGFSESGEYVNKTRDAVDHGLWLRDDQAAVIARLYDTVLERDPDAVGLTSWKGALQGGITLQQIADGFTNSPEFIEKYGNLDNLGFVQQLYRNVLDRDGEASGVAAWKGELDSGKLTRADVVLGFSESIEHQIKTADHIDNGIFLV
jgi:hypothetical protein